MRHMWGSTRGRESGWRGGRLTTLLRRAGVGLATFLVAGAVTGTDVCASLTASPSATATAALPGYGQADLQADLDAITATGATGVQALVSQPPGQDLVAVSGHADVGTRTPVPVNGHYRVGSNAKTFVATVVLQLVAERRLSLDDTVEQHLPGVVRGNGHDGRRVTVRQLLQHTSGIANHTDVLAAKALTTAGSYRQHRYDRYEDHELVAVAMQQPPNFAPGSSWSYSNTNYVLAGMIVEKLTGRPWHQEVTSRIIEPLGLANTTAGNGPDLPQPHARGYHEFSPGDPLVDTTVFDPSFGGAAGDVNSTPKDLARFFRALLGGRLLPPTQLAEMRRTVPADEFQDDLSPDYRYGLGLSWSSLSCGGGYWHHGGDVPGYQSREGFTDGGGRGVVVSISTTRSDPAGVRSQAQTTLDLVDRVLCAGT